MVAEDQFAPLRHCNLTLRTCNVYRQRQGDWEVAARGIAAEIVAF
jgi:hypothetical protein